MKKALFAVLFAALVLASCNWELSDDDADLNDAVITTTTETTETVEKVSTFKNGVLSCYVIRYISDVSARTVDQEQFYNADGTLRYSWKYGRNAGGLVTTAAYYTSSGALSHYYAYAYNVDETVDTQVEYDSAGLVNWLKRYETNASGGIRVAASFNASLSLTGALEYYYIDETAGWNMEIAYGSDSGSLSGDVKGDNPSAGPVTTSSLSAEAKRSLALPSASAIPSPVIPDPASSGLSVSGYRFSFDDAHGNTLVSLDENHYPRSGTRTDDRLDKAVQAELTYDSGNRIVSKKIWYGTTLALNVDIDYLGSTLYPARVETSGKSMLVPLNYTIDYGENCEIDTMRVYSGKTLLRRLVYDYTTPVTATVAPRNVRSMDPFSFLGDMLKAGVTIYDYDGDGTLVETFSATSDATGVTVEVRLPNAAGEPGGALNGSFRIIYDDEGNCASLTAYGKGGAQVWREEFSLFTDRWDELDTAAGGDFDSSVSYGSMIESLLPADSSSAVTKVQENFLYSFLF